MKKQVIYGYVHRKADKPLAFPHNGTHIITGLIYETPGKPWQWSTTGWPPRKVRVTVEEVKP